MTAGNLPCRVRDSEVPIRLFFDESCLGIARVVAQARADAIFPGHPRSPVHPSDLDKDWIPVVASRGWVVVLRDKKIRKRPAELAALATNPLRALVLTSAGQMGVWDQLRVLLRYWDEIEELMEQRPPWLVSVTKKGLRAEEYPAM